MNIFKRAWSWRKESSQHTIGEDFGGDIEVGTTRGIINLVASFIYDRFTGVYDTEFFEFWRASALHDWCCVRLRDFGCVQDIDGNIIMTHQWEADEEFLLEMLQAARRVLMRLRREGNNSAKHTKIVRKLVKRALHRHWGVRRWDRIARRIGVRKHV